MNTVQADSLITLHYRLAGDDDTTLVTTFDSSPATLQLGSGELAPALEACLVGLPIGERFVFLLEPGQAFGEADPARLQWLPRRDLPDDLAVGALIEFAAPDDQRFVGIVRELDDERARVDFNHPLAGRGLRFEVEIIGIL